jgi:hypothetical protein
VASARRAVAVVLGAAVGAALVLLVFFRPGWDGGPTLAPRFDLGAFLSTLPAHRRWVGPFLALAATLPASRSLVWRMVLPPPPPARRDVYHATALGALVQSGLPGKLGPLAAAWLLSRFARRPFAPALSSQLVAKLLELGAVVALGAAASAIRPAGGLGKVPLVGGAVFAAFALAAIAGARLAPSAGERLRLRFPRAAGTVAALGEGLRGTGSLRRLAAAVAACAAPACTVAAAYGIALAGIGVEGWLAGGAMVVALLTLGQLTPGLPVGTGVYWSLAAWSARSLGASPADAAALAVLSHVSMVAANVTVGGFSALVRRGALREAWTLRARR